MRWEVRCYEGLGEGRVKAKVWGREGIGSTG